jgi:hypothetical protein
MKYKSICNIIQRVNKNSITEFINVYNKTTDICNNCVYYRREPVKEHSLCLRFGKDKEDKVTGINFLTAKFCREDITRCGLNAKYYRSR